MASRLSLLRRIRTAARWPLGVTLTSWRYMWRTVPMSRKEYAVHSTEDASPPFPAGFDSAEVQTEQEGVGPLYHRRYRVRIAEPELTPEQLLVRMREDLDQFAPSEFASFQKRSDDAALRPGDEYVVRMPGPWDGPVRVIDDGDTWFRLATLSGHLEAGQIQFRAEVDGSDLRFTIESWARSGDRFSNLLYTHALMAKEIQLHMWVSFLERVADASGGRRSGSIEIETRRVEEPVGA